MEFLQIGCVAQNLNIAIKTCLWKQLNVEKPLKHGGQDFIHSGAFFETNPYGGVLKRQYFLHFLDPVTAKSLYLVHSYLL